MREEQNENSIDIEVNTIFYVGDKKIKVAKTVSCNDCDRCGWCECECESHYYCFDCFFYEKKECKYYECQSYKRKDKTEVVFLEQMK